MIGLQSPPLYGIIWAKYSKKLLHSGFLDFYSLNFSEGKVPSDFRTDFNPLDWMFGRQVKCCANIFCLQVPTYHLVLEEFLLLWILWSLGTIYLHIRTVCSCCLFCWNGLNWFWAVWVRATYTVRGRSQTMLTRFWLFWSPTPLRWHFLPYKRWQKSTFLDYLPTPLLL